MKNFNFRLRSFLLCLLCLAGLGVMTGCRGTEPVRTVSIVIPGHPWETEGVEKLWYSVRWTYGSGGGTVFVDNKTRNVEFEVPLGANLIVCAYPMDDMIPFGALIRPESAGAGVVLNQDSGFLADLLLGIDGRIACSVNFEKLEKYAAESTPDFRLLDSDILVTDILNGKLSEKSFRVLEKVLVKDLLFYPGIWESESVHENALSVLSDGVAPDLELALGVHRYLCVNRNLEIRIVVSRDGVFKYERPALISGLT